MERKISFSNEFYVFFIKFPEHGQVYLTQADYKIACFISSWPQTVRQCLIGRNYVCCSSNLIPPLDVNQIAGSAE